MSKARWSKKEQLKIIGNIVFSGLLENTKKKTKARKQIIESIIDELEFDQDFQARQMAGNRRDTIGQHIRVWIRHLEDGAVRPPLGF